MRAGLTITRNIAAARVDVAAAVDRHVARAGGIQDRAGTWHEVDWTSSLRSWRRVGSWRGARHDVALTVDLLRIGAGFTQVELRVDRPGRLRDRVARADLIALATRIRDTAEGGRTSDRSTASGRRPAQEVPAAAVPAVGYSLP